MSYSIRHISGIVDGEFLRFRGDDPIEHLLLDSRRLIFPATSLFFALRGPRRDGMSYLEELYRRGVRNFIVSGTPNLIDIPEANVIIVTDTLAALQRLAAFHRAQFSIPVVAITGSNGKTIVKEWLNELLEADYSIVRSPKSYNSQLGVPLSVWQLQPVHTLAIFEAGISRRQEMERLEAILKPTIGIFTNIGEAHNEGFSSLAEKVAEKLKLFDGSKALISCGDQRETSAAIWKWKGERADASLDTPDIVSWGREYGNDIWLQTFEDLGNATRVGITFGGISGEIIFPFTEHASVENAMHCVAACLWLKLPIEKIAARVGQHHDRARGKAARRRRIAGDRQRVST